MADSNLKARVLAALQSAFPGPLDRVHVHDGYQSNVHVWVASPSFEGQPDYVRQDRVWDALKGTLVDGDLVLVSLILTFTPDEPEYLWALRERAAA